VPTSGNPPVKRPIAAKVAPLRDFAGNARSNEFGGAALRRDVLRREIAALIQKKIRLHCDRSKSMV
jgi:hypothetical protein